MSDDIRKIDALRWKAEQSARIEALEASLTAANARLDQLEHALAPRLKAILTLRALRFALKERNRRKRAATNTTGAERETVTPTKAEGRAEWPGFGIALFGHTRSDLILNSLESLAKQDALHVTHVFLDGHQGRLDLMAKTERVYQIVNAYPVKEIHRQNSAFGFRKMMLLAGEYMMRHYERMLFLEDDCFPVDGSIAAFNADLDEINKREDIFSVYGHHFLTPNEADPFPRFQGWGWATTAQKLRPVWDELKKCYLMSEADYLRFVKEKLTPDIRARIDVTPDRQPTDTLERFFAWDETVCLLTALRGQGHKPSAKRLIYNCGAGLEASHFKRLEQFRKPPFNMIAANEVWDYF